MKYTQVQVKTLKNHFFMSFSLKLCTDRRTGTLIESDGTICCMYTIVSS